MLPTDVNGEWRDALKDFQEKKEEKKNNSISAEIFFKKGKTIQERSPLPKPPREK